MFTFLATQPYIGKLKYSFVSLNGDHKFPFAYNRGSMAGNDIVNGAIGRRLYTNALFFLGGYRFTNTETYIYLPILSQVLMSQLFAVVFLHRIDLFD